MSLHFFWFINRVYLRRDFSPENDGLYLGRAEIQRKSTDDLLDFMIDAPQNQLLDCGAVEGLSQHTAPSTMDNLPFSL